MSKMRRKWIRVIEFEENGTPIDENTRAQLLETHPDLPLLQQQHHQQQSHVPQAQMGTMGTLEAPMGDPSQQQQMNHHAFQPTHHVNIDSQLDQQLHDGLSRLNDMGGMNVQHLG